MKTQRLINLRYEILIIGFTFLSFITLLVTKSQSYPFMVSQFLLIIPHLIKYRHTSMSLLSNKSSISKAIAVLYIFTDVIAMFLLFLAVTGVCGILTLSKGIILFSKISLVSTNFSVSFWPLALLELIFMVIIDTVNYEMKELGKK